MRKRKQQKKEAAETAEVAEELVSAFEELKDEAGEISNLARDEPDLEGEVSERSSEERLRDLTEEVEVQKDRYLRLAAEFDNFRKRTVRERGKLATRAKADLASGILDGLDDLDRVSKLDPETTSSKDIIDGVELVERKLFRELELAGLERVGLEGAPFDPNYHEAVSASPAPDADKLNMIAAVLQVGYRMGSVLLRPARVQVFIEPQSDEESEA
jgi:molecular chaperone GrpE